MSFLEYMERKYRKETINRLYEHDRKKFLIEQSNCEDLLFVRLNANAKSPIYGTIGAAGADLCSAEKCIIPANGECYLADTLIFYLR